MKFILHFLVLCKVITLYLHHQNNLIVTIKYLNYGQRSIKDDFGTATRKHYL